jgi:hypothetical protein
VTRSHTDREGREGIMENIKKNGQNREGREGIMENIKKWTEE